MDSVVSVYWEIYQLFTNFIKTNLSLFLTVHSKQADLFQIQNLRMIVCFVYQRNGLVLAILSGCWRCPPTWSPPVEIIHHANPSNFSLVTRQEPCKIMQCNLWKCSSAISRHKIFCEWKQVMHKRQATLNYGSLYRHNALPFLFCSEVVDVFVHAVNALPYCEQSGWHMVTEGTVSSGFLAFISMLRLPPWYFFKWCRNTNTWKQIPESSGRL